MTIAPASPALATPLLDTLRQRGAGAPAAAAAPFAGALEQALRSVSAAQSRADALADAFQRDPSSVSLEETMVAMQQAQIGFQSALHVRNRLVSAYSDIMNMQV